MNLSFEFIRRIFHVFRNSLVLSPRQEEQPTLAFGSKNQTILRKTVNLLPAKPKTQVMNPLPSPDQLKQRLPAPSSFIQKSRETAAAILTGHDSRLALIVGPCSIHDPALALAYAERLQQLRPLIEKKFFPIMRLFIEKPRTLGGWKGILYDPFLDGSHDIGHGLQLARELWVELAKREMPCATELLDPLAAPYFDDLIIWGLIGARTAASQPHRQLASGLKFPIGFKNDFKGELDVAIAGVVSSRLSHSHLGLDAAGRIARVETQGNLLTHLVLRGAEHQTNFDAASVAKALQELSLYDLEPRLIIDCSHGNSGKDHRRQKIAFETVMKQVREGSSAIRGLMLESHLYAGKQALRFPLRYGVSVTDSCMSWEETESLLLSHR